MKNPFKSLLLFSILTLSISIVRGQSTGEAYTRAKELYDAKNYQAALPLMRKAAENNHTEAQIYLGVMYENGYGTTVDVYEAVKWFRKSAEQGYHWGQHNLGIMYRDGKGVKRDFSLAIYYFQKAAEQNNENAFASLGHMIENGQGITKNFHEAISLYQKSARLGYKWAQDSLTTLGYSW